MLRGMLAMAGAVLILGIWALADFSGLFVTFHRVAFRNDGWLLNPKTDLLIRLMPTGFFTTLAVRVLLWAVGAAIAAAITARWMSKGAFR